MDEAWWVSETDLDEDQKRVIALGIDGRHLLIGPPGSGKTNLLLLRANYISAAGRPNLLILVFTRALREFIAAGASQYSFPSSKVQTYNGWARRILSENAIEVPESDDFEEERKNLLSGLKRLVKQEKITDQYYDAIFLDEAHDYLANEIQLLTKFSRNIFAAVDSRQQIYRKDLAGIEFLKSVCDTVELRFHYRNGVQICKLADMIMAGKALYAPLEPTSHYKESNRPSSVNHYSCASLEEQCDIVLERLSTQLDAYPGELIGVICPGRDELGFIQTRLNESSLGSLCIFQNSSTGYRSFDATHPICVSTIHAAKGLEFTALHLLACETFLGFKKTNRNLTFTGVTRAKTSLSLYYSGDLYGYLQKALSALFPRLDIPPISEAFGPRR